MNFRKFNQCLISTQIKREWEKKKKEKGTERMKEKKEKKEKWGVEKDKKEKNKGRKEKEEGGVGPASTCLCSCHLTPRVQSQQRFLMAVWPEMVVIRPCKQLQLNSWFTSWLRLETFLCPVIALLS